MRARGRGRGFENAPDSFSVCVVGKRTSTGAQPANIRKSHRHLDLQGYLTAPGFDSVCAYFFLSYLNSMWRRSSTPTSMLTPRLKSFPDPRVAREDEGAGAAAPRLPAGPVGGPGGRADADGANRGTACRYVVKLTCIHVHYPRTSASSSLNPVHSVKKCI